jgi:hypothetical protein
MKLNQLNYTRCPGVPAIGHSCNSKVPNKMRCQNCQRVYDTYRASLAELKPERIERWCLRCFKKFIARNKFLRLCKGCRRVNSSYEYSGMDDTQYIVNVARRCK